jgi:hypothetical protein
MRTPKEKREAKAAGGRIGGRISGRHNVESGHMARISSQGARCANHFRWHVERNIFNPECELCVAKQS